MSSKAITEEREGQTGTPGSRPREVAPSVIREEEPQLARSIGIISLVAVLFGADLMCWLVYNVSLLRAAWWGILRMRGLPVGPTGPALSWFGALFGTVFFFAGLGGLLLHATIERDQQLRRAYGVLGSLWLVLGAVLIIFNIFGAGWAANYFVPGVVCGLLALLFFLAFLRHETEAEWHNLAVNVIAIVGGVLAVGAFLGSNIRAAFLLPDGLLLALLGLAYLWASLAVRGSDDELSHRIALAAAGVGVLVCVVALVRAYVVPWFYSAATRPGPYMVPTGVMLIGLGLLYVLCYVLYYVDNQVVVMSRRELTAFFYSPIAYLVLFAYTVVGWWSLLAFLNSAVVEPGQEARLFEPVVRNFFWGFFPVVAVIVIVPALTMRSFSEEKRTGTMELLLTIPVDEWSVVLSKFLGTLAFFLLLWVPWLVFAFTVCVAGKQARVPEKELFELTPLLSFLLVLVCMGANFVSMGLFFSSVTRNQIISFVLSFAGMIGLLFVYFGAYMLKEKLPNSPWVGVLTHMSFVDLWSNSLDGQIQPQYLLFHVTAAVFWLFLTVKVLEARKWS
jgi:ABC-type transport system involved in multi-copper enzyme maturation permease subunit